MYGFLPTNCNLLWWVMTGYELIIYDNLVLLFNTPNLLFNWSFFHIKLNSAITISSWVSITSYWNYFTTLLIALSTSTIILIVLVVLLISITIFLPSLTNVVTTTTYNWYLWLKNNF